MRVAPILLLASLLFSASPVPLRAGTAVGLPADPSSPSLSRIPAVVTDSESLETDLLRVAPTLRPEALRAALAAWDDVSAKGEISRPILTVIDYGLSSMTKRMWVFDLASRRLLFHELVAHGKNSGEDLATRFSNEEGSLMTSLGAFVTGSTYDGKNGYSMRLRGMERGRNDRAEERTIVVHGAPYVGDEVAEKLGRLGRSWGCPALRPAIARTLIDEVKDRTLLYAYHPSLDAPNAPAGPAAAIAGAGSSPAGGSSRATR
jgi:hypothetical protein